MEKFKGWDFSHLKGRKLEEKPPWNYTKLARQLIKRSSSVIDMGTGGGELFSTFKFRKAVATEGYRPNYLIAKKRLEPLGVKVVFTVGLPFGCDFDLVLNRHSAFNAKEVFHVLKPGGTFLTQQVDGDNLADLVKAFGRKPGKSVFRRTLSNVKVAGFSIVEAERCILKTEFKDIDALVYFLHAIPWVVENFSVDKDQKILMKLQKKLEKGKLVFKETRFIIQAEKS